MQGADPTILFVDDEQFVLMATQQIVGQIEVQGQSVTPACHFVGSGQEAIDVCKERLDNGKDLYKLIFMDIGLGEGKPDGLEITK